MNRVIEIEKCAVCPYYSLRNQCMHPDIIGKYPYKAKDIPNQPEEKKEFVFPDFCPLETAEDFAESNFKI